MFVIENFENTISIYLLKVAADDRSATNKK